jgi:hypothetical protein
MANDLAILRFTAPANPARRPEHAALGDVVIGIVS